MKHSASGVKDNFIGRINADLYRILSVALQQKMGNENFASVDILRVETAPDLGSARVYVNSAVGAKELEKSVGFLRTEIANNMKIKRVPNLRFIVDNGEQNAQRVDELLKIINGGAK